MSPRTGVEYSDARSPDVAEHFVGRGFRGKAMYVAIDKATAVRMYDLVQKHWAAHLAKFEAKLATTPELERPPLVETIEFMRTTDMAVVLSQSQNEVADMADLGLDIAKHRKRMNEEDLDSKFKDPADPFRLVFVCAMWLTGFDAPSCSTIYLDKPMRNHALMQTIARANRVFPEKDSGLIVDYVGVFRNLEAALAIYGASREGDYTPIAPKDALSDELEAALAELVEFLDANDVDLADLEVAKGFEFIALQKAAVEALLIDDATRRRYVSLARRVRTVFKSLLPDPAAQQATHRVAVIRSLAAKLESITEAPEIGDVMDAVSELLDRSVGAEEYVIRAGGDAGPLVDLNQLDFEQLALRFAGNKRTAAKQIERNLEARLDVAVRKNPTRLDLAERFRRLIDEYNAGTHNLEEFLRRLKAINDELTDEEQRTVREDLSEDELAIYDLLTKPEPDLSEAESIQVKATAKRLLVHVTEKLVLDWRKRQHTRAAVQVAVGEILDADLPEVYGPALFDDKVRRVYEHIYASYFDNGQSVYTGGVEAPPAVVPVATLPTPDDVDDRLLDQARNDPALFAQLMEELYGTRETWFRSTEELLASETRSVEFKQTARWNVKEQRKDKTMEDVIVKTVAGFLNGHGGTLLIGVTDSRAVVGLDEDYGLVKPPNADGYVGWLDTLLETSLGHGGAHRVQIRVEVIGGRDICRLDVPASSRPIWAKGKDGDVLYERRNNSTRAVPEHGIAEFLAERFPQDSR
ncbi:MAG: DUF3387 domain-containing protein [Actinomycetota bacterium]|nr:DUF3387 domain-containing protein [Actinomycetota bacterium]